VCQDTNFWTARFYFTPPLRRGEDPETASPLPVPQGVSFPGGVLIARTSFVRVLPSLLCG